MLLRKLISLLLFFIPLLISAQFVDRDHADYKAYYYENGQISSEGLLQEGKPNGYWITYYPNQLRKSEGNRIDFKLEGIWKFYDKKGNLKEAISYEEGKRSGPTKKYENCHLQRVDQYQSGIQEGLSKLYYPDSTDSLLKATIPFVNGRKDGMAYYYARDGRLVEIIDYQKGFIAKKEIINQLDEEGEKQGIWKEYYENGRLKVERRYKDDALNGYVKRYSSQGKLEGADLFLKGEKQSEEQNDADFDLIYTYYDDGSVKSSITYNKAGEKDGVSQYYSKEGEVIRSEIYENDYLIARGILDKRGVKTGDWETYYLNGNIKSKGAYKGGEKYGKWVYYFTSGEKEQEGFYDNAGRFTGEWRWYYENGNLLRSEEFLRGKEDGMLVEYDIDSTLITKGEYLDGDKEGEWFYQLNDHQEIGKYLYGERNGFWKHTYPNGQIAFEGNYQSGRPHGKHKYYNKKGVLIRLEEYDYGKRDGKWKWYDENGIEYMSIVYRDGEERKIDGARFKLSSK